MSVNFLQEVETTCFLLSSAHTSCGNLQDTTYSILSPWNASVSHVGRVGDPNPNNLSEWVKVRNARGPSTMQVSVCVCVCVCVCMCVCVCVCVRACVVFVYEFSCLKINFISSHASTYMWMPVISFGGLFTHVCI